MPVIRPWGHGKALLTLKTHLADLLFKELMGETTRRGPFIFEDPVAPGEIDVIVVWEAWDGLPPGERAAVIREAYSRYSRTLENGTHFPEPANTLSDPIIPKVRMAIGATWKEAVEHNLLPVSIFPTSKPEAVDPNEVETIMLESGAIETPSGIQLRFPNARLASEVHARLTEEMPEACWSITEETGSADD